MSDCIGRAVPTFHRRASKSTNHPPTDHQVHFWFSMRSHSELPSALRQIAHNPIAVISLGTNGLGLEVK